MLLNEINDCIQQAVRQLLATDGWRRYQGEQAYELTQRLGAIIGQTSVELTSSGTAALEIVLRAAGVKTGDEVLLSAYDYPGNFWAIERTGARPVLLDVAPASWSIDHTALADAYRPACKAVVASHLHGELQSMRALRSWCDDHNMLLIEDTCQSIGATYVQSDQTDASDPSVTGSLGHAAIVSFGGGKVLSCGRGGAWGTSDEALAQRARLAAGAGSGPYGLSEIQAAIVLAQLPWLAEINRRCRIFFGALNKHLEAVGCNWKFVAQRVGNSTAFYQAGWLLPANYAVDPTEPAAISLRDQLVNLLQNALPQNASPPIATTQGLSTTQDLDVSSGSLNQTAAIKIPFGVGFPGFHRRSSRRCRLPSGLSNAIMAAERTLVLHHSVVLEERFTAEQIASRIVASDAVIASTPSTSISST